MTAHNIINKFRYIVNKSVTRRDQAVNQPIIVSRAAWLGDNNGVITTYGGTTLPDGYVVVRDLDGNLSIALNQRVPNIAGLPINVGFDPLQPTLFQVLSQRDSYSNQPYVSLPSHHATHEAFGSDQVWISGAQILPALVTGNNGLILTVFPSFYIKSDGSWGYLQYQTFDMTSNLPTSGAIAYLLCVLDDGTLSIVNGTTEATPELITAADFPVAPDATYHPICAVRMWSGQIVIAQNATYTDIFDLRFLNSLRVISSSRMLFNMKAKTTSTSGYPGDGYILWNNATQINATQINISHLTDDDLDIELFLGYIANGEQIVIQNQDASQNYQIWNVSGTPTLINGGTSTAYYQIPVTLSSSSGTGTTGFSNNHPLILAIFGGGASITAGVGIAISGSTVSQNIDNGTAVTSLADADELGTWNAIAAAFRKITWANIKASIKTYTDTLYVALSTAFSGDGSGAFPALTVQSSHWNTQSVSAAATLVDGSAPVVLTDTTSTAFTLKLPATPTAKSWFWIVDDTGKWSTNNLTLDPNGKNINGSSSTIVLRTQYAVVRVYFDGTQWILIGQTYPAPVIEYFDNMLSATVAAGTTVYLCPFIDAVQTSGRAMPILHPGVVKNLYVRLSATQPASGSLVITVQINNVNTSIQVTIPAGGGGAATYTDLTHTVINAAGDYIGFQIVNNATAASAPIGFVVVEVQPTG